MGTTMEEVQASRLKYENKAGADSFYNASGNAGLTPIAQWTFNGTEAGKAVSTWSEHPTIDNRYTCGIDFTAAGWDAPTIDAHKFLNPNYDHQFTDMPVADQPEGWSGPNTLNYTSQGFGVYALRIPAGETIQVSAYLNIMRYPFGAAGDWSSVQAAWTTWAQVALEPDYDLWDDEPGAYYNQGSQPLDGANFYDPSEAVGSTWLTGWVTQWNNLSKGPILTMYQAPQDYDAYLSYFPMTTFLNSAVLDNFTDDDFFYTYMDLRVFSVGSRLK